MGGRNPALKDSSPYTSFKGPGYSRELSKSFGRFEIKVDIEKLTQDLGESTESASYTPHEAVEADLHAAIGKVMGDKLELARASDLKIDSQNIQTVAAELNLSKMEIKKLKPLYRALENATRDRECLYKGIVPSKYINGPFEIRW